MTMLYQWKPGFGPDPRRLARMQAQTVRPLQPMGEAWFMGGERRKLFTYLVEDDLANQEPARLIAPLEEIASGTISFGPMAEWQEWFHFLMPRLVEVGLQPESAEIQELLVTALMSQYPIGMSAPLYEGFREDVLRTLGQSIMDASKWDGESVVLDRTLHAPPEDGGGGDWWRASGDLSSSLFLCLKYLDAEEIEAWAESVLAIRDPYWRAQIILWLLGAARLLRKPGLQPAEVHGKDPVGRLGVLRAADG